MKLVKTKCMICETMDNSTIVYKERLPSNGIDAKPYAPRRDRDYYHYQFVKCNNCGLVRSDPIIEIRDLSDLYSYSECTYTDKNENLPLKITYGAYLEKMINFFSIKKESYLDIGCANGFMLEKAQELGFQNIVGVEPSLDSIKKAKDEIRTYIIEGMFDENMFRSEQFDVITFFQTFDHVTEPNKFLKNCFNILKSKGFILAINHNVGSFSAKILGERSPIFDIGHAYLYDFKTMKKIFENNGFKVLDIFSVKNVMNLERLIHLLPFNKKKINALQKFLSITKLDKYNIPLYVGNLGIIAQKLE